ncbi:MAG: hypothetical protein IT560_01940 [Alphaproteobacteria bacterium]|nr:hypothetical protein [Alphaproteobacteria bacterium]
METPPITDDDIQRIVATATMAEFRAAIAPWQDDGAARKKMVQKLHGGIDDYFTWQKHEALRLWRELEGAEPNVATVLAAEVRRFGNRLAGKDYAALSGLALEYAPGFLEEIENRFKAHGARGPDVHRAVMNDISDPVSRYLSREGKGIQARRKKYPDMRMTIGRDAAGAAVFALVSPAEQADEAEKKRQQERGARRIAEIPDIAGFIEAVLKQDAPFRKIIRAQLDGVAGDALLTWQKHEAFAMLAAKQTPDAAALQLDARLDAALDEARLQFQNQFKKAVKHLPVVAGPALRQKLGETAFNNPAKPVRQQVADYFVTPLAQWMRENWQSVSAQAQADTQIIVDDLPAGGQPIKPRIYSARLAMNEWLKSGPKTATPVTAPRTASFRRTPKPVT